MAGHVNGRFKELISPFLKAKMKDAARRFGRESAEYVVMSRQYVVDARESAVDFGTQRDRHYHSEMPVSAGGTRLRGVERLYRRTGLLVATTACSAHCRWCLRGHYDVDTLKPEEIRAAAKHFGSKACADDVREVLITGGDPLMAPVLVECALAEITAHAPNIDTVRIGTRLFMQDPERIDEQMVHMFARYRGLRLEIGTHFNHPIEFWPETVDAMRRLQEVGVLIYNQHPLLKGVNDSLDVLCALYDLMRRHRVESHYLFHCVPMWGMDHHRTSVARGSELAGQLSSGGAFSGRSKPLYAAMTDVGKVVLYEGSILARNRENQILLRTGYRLADRLRWNPAYRLPPTAAVDDEGCIRTWYQDGEDGPYEAPTTPDAATLPALEAVS